MFENLRFNRANEKIFQFLDSPDSFPSRALDRVVASFEDLTAAIGGDQHRSERAERLTAILLPAIFKRDRTLASRILVAMTENASDKDATRKAMLQLGVSTLFSIVHVPKPDIRDGLGLYCITLEDMIEDPKERSNLCKAVADGLPGIAETHHAKWYIAKKLLGWAAPLPAAERRNAVESVMQIAPSIVPNYGEEALSLYRNALSLTGDTDDQIRILRSCLDQVGRVEIDTSDASADYLNLLLENTENYPNLRKEAARRAIMLLSQKEGYMTGRRAEALTDRLLNLGRRDSRFLSSALEHFAEPSVLAGSDPKWRRSIHTLFLGLLQRARSYPDIQAQAVTKALKAVPEIASRAPESGRAIVTDLLSLANHGSIPSPDSTQMPDWIAAAHALPGEASHIKIGIMQMLRDYCPQPEAINQVDQETVKIPGSFTQDPSKSEIETLDEILRRALRDNDAQVTLAVKARGSYLIFNPSETDNEGRPVVMTVPCGNRGATTKDDFSKLAEVVTGNPGALRAMGELARRTLANKIRAPQEPLKQ